MIKEQWGNIELPGVSDKELLNKDWNRVARSRANWDNPDYVARVEAARIAFMADPDYQAHLARRAQAQSQAVTDEFRNHMANLSTEKWLNPEFRAKTMQSREQYWADPANREERSVAMQEVAKRPEVKAAQLAGAKRRAKDPKDLALRKEVGARNKANPAFKAAIQASVTPERIEKFKAATLKHKKPVVTPLGVFRCVTDAAKAHDVNNGCLRARISKNDPDNFRYITLEEYIMLTGKDL